MLEEVSVTTKKEHFKQVLKESKELDDAWHELFGDPNSKTTEEWEFDMDRELNHPPIALNRLVRDCYGDVINIANKAVAQEREKGATPEELFQVMSSVLINLGIVTSFRMFQVGQHTAMSHPFKTLGQCPCEILFDEDVEKLLSEPYNVEGEGWVILNFGRTETEE